jgi:hypothetical protein
MEVLPLTLVFCARDWRFAVYLCFFLPGFCCIVVLAPASYCRTCIVYFLAALFDCLFSVVCRVTRGGGGLEGAVVQLFSVVCIVVFSLVLSPVHLLWW